MADTSSPEVSHKPSLEDAPDSNRSTKRYKIKDQDPPMASNAKEENSNQKESLPPQKDDYIVILFGTVNSSPAVSLAVPLKLVFQHINPTWRTLTEERNALRLRKAERLMLDWNKIRAEKGQDLIDMDYVCRAKYLQRQSLEPWTVNHPEFQKWHAHFEKGVQSGDDGNLDNGLGPNDYENFQLEAFLEAYQEVSRGEEAIHMRRCKVPPLLWVVQPCD